MSRVFTVKPPDGWHAGDRAYCVEGSRRSLPSLEVGRVYEVARVIPIKGHVDDGLVLRGITPPRGMRGFWSGRFVKLRPGGKSDEQIRQSTRRGWLEAYRASNPQPDRPTPPDKA